MPKLKVAIFGLGGIGGLLGSIINHKKIFLSTYQKNNLKKIEINLDSTLYGKIKKKIPQRKSFNNYDIILICTKYPYLRRYTKIINKTKALIIPLLNGILHYEILKKKKANFFYANIGKVVSYKNRNIIIHNSKTEPEILISSMHKSKKDLKKINFLLKNIKIKYKFINNNSFVLFNKFIRISSLSAITALYNNNLGQIRKNKKKKIELTKLIKEAIFVTHKIYNIKFSYNKILQEINSFPDNLTTSMQRDINKDKKSEIETQIGAIKHLAENNKVKAPITIKTYKRLLNIIKNGKKKNS